jgi:hypothetical protein
MSEVQTWSVTAASNNSSPPDGAPENMARSAVNNVMRELMAVIKRWQADTNGSITSGGTANAQTIAANRTTTSAYAGESFTFKAGATNTGALTVNITPSGGSARGVVAVQKNGAALAGGEIVSGGIYTIRYDGTQYQLDNYTSGVFSDGSVGTPGWRFGADPDNGAYRIGTNNWALAAAGAKVWEVSAAGEITTPLQPAFLAVDNTGTANATGDGTTATAAWPTEIYDQNADFASNTFTAPVTGRYHFNVCVYLESLGAGHTSLIVSLVASNRTLRLYQCNIGAIRTATNTATVASGIDVDMDAADTVTIAVQISNSTKTVTVGGASSFSGRLVA